jgi:hypothetical protein
MPLHSTGQVFEALHGISEVEFAMSGRYSARTILQNFLTPPPMLICHVQLSKQGPSSPLHFQCQNVVQQVVNILKIPVLY